MTDEPRRSLTEDERAILGYIRELYGDHNTPDDVFFSDSDEAVIFVKDRDGSMPICVVLTNVGRWARQGGLSRDEVCRGYLIPH